MNPDEIFASLPRVGASVLADRQRPTCANFADLVRVGPITRDGEGWQLHPGADSAPRAAFRWIVAVRAGCPVVPPGWDEAMHHTANALVEPIVDLAALSVDFRRPLGSLYGAADVLGTPQEYGWTESIRLRRDPLAWLAGGMHGACLLRPVADCADFLRGFEKIVCDDIEHGERVHNALRRAYSGPEILVPAAAVA